MASSAPLLKAHKRAIWQEALHGAALEVFDALLGVRLEAGDEDYSHSSHRHRARAL